MFSNRLLPRSVPVRTHSTSAASSPRARKGAGHKLAIGAAIVAALAIAMPGTASATKVYPKVVPGKHFGAGGGAVVPIFACAGGIIFAALAANYRDNRQLSTDEAWSCGLFYWFSQPTVAHAKERPLKERPLRAKG